MKKLQLVSENDRNVPYKATFVTEALDMIRQDGSRLEVDDEIVIIPPGGSVTG